MQHSLIRTLAKLTCVVIFSIWSIYTLTLLSFSQLETPKAYAQAFPPGIRDTPVFTPTPDPTEFAPGPTTDQSVRDAINNQAPGLPTSPGSGTPGGGTGTDTTTGAAQPAAAVQVNPGNGISSFIYDFVITYVGRFMSLAGYFFDYTFSEFIIRFGQNFRESNTGWAVQQVWGTVRDIFNLTFIFGIIYIGFRLILNGDDSRAKSTLVTLLAAALLVNFSLFITKFVIDVANITATEIARSVPDIPGNTAGGPIDITEEGPQFGRLFVYYLGLSTALSGNILQPSAASETGQADSNINIGYIFGLMLLFLITAFVLLAGAIIVTIRYFVLLMYMIFSPFMFLGWVFPNFAGVSSRWWSGFLGKAFFAPAYVFMLYITLLLMTQYAQGRPDPRQASDMGAIFNNTIVDGAGEAFAYFALVTVSLLASLVIAQKMGATGATTAIAWGQQLRRSGQSYIGRNTVGRASERLDNLNNYLEGSRSGRNVKRFVTAASLGTFDERTRRNVLNAGKNAKFGGSYSRSDDKKFSAEISTTRAQGELESIVKKGIYDSASDTEKIAFEREIAGANQSQLIDLISKYGENTPEYRKIVRAMSHSQVNKLLEAKDEEISPSSRAALAKERSAQVKNRLTSLPPGATGTAPTIAQGVARASIDDLMALGFDELMLNAKSISSGRMDDLKTKMVATEYALLTAKRETDLWNDFNTLPTSVFSGKKDNEIARLPKKILMDPRSTTSLNQRVLEIILRENYLESSERAVVRNNISSAAGGGHVPQMQAFLATPIGLAF